MSHRTFLSNIVIAASVLLLVGGIPSKAHAISVECLYVYGAPYPNAHTPATLVSRVAFDWAETMLPATHAVVNSHYQNLTTGHRHDEGPLTYFSQELPVYTYVTNSAGNGLTRLYTHARSAFFQYYLTEDYCEIERYLV